METVFLPDFALVYAHLLFRECLYNKDNKVAFIHLSNLCGKKTSFDIQYYDRISSYYFSESCVNPFITFTTEFTEDKFSNSTLKKDLEKLYLSLDSKLSKYFDSLVIIEEVKKLSSDIINFKLKSFSVDKENVLNLLKIIVEQFVTRCLNSKEITATEHSIYLILKVYFDYFLEDKPNDNNLSLFNKLFAFYNKISRKNLIPVYFISKENNIVIESNPFPEEVLLKIFALMNIKISNNYDQYILTSTGKNFIEDESLYSLYFHEIGHLFDNNLINLEYTVSNDLIANKNDCYRSIDIEMLSWIKELIADAFGISIGGPSFILALLDFFNDTQSFYAEKTHPGIAFRLQILYTYLLQNQFTELFEPEQLDKIEERIRFYQNTYSSKEEIFIQYENVLNQYISIIYKSITQFLQATGNYVSYSDYCKILCDNNGSLNKTREFLLNQEDSLKNVIFLMNINKFIELKQG